MVTEKGVANVKCMVIEKGVANVKMCGLQINYMATHLQEDPQVIGTVYIPITKSVEITQKKHLVVSRQFVFS